MSDLFAIATIITSVFSGIATGITAFGTSSCSKVSCTSDGILCEMTKRSNSHPPPETTSANTVKISGVKDSQIPPPPPPSDQSKVDPLSKDGEVLLVNTNDSQYDINDKAETLFSSETKVNSGAGVVDKRLSGDGKLLEPSVGVKTNFKLPNSSNTSIDILTKTNEIKRSYVNANVDIISSRETSIPNQSKNRWSKLKEKFNPT